MHRDLMAEALTGAPEAAAQTAQNGQVPLTYTIVRTAGGKTSEITADENHAGQAGGRHQGCPGRPADKLSRSGRP